MNNVVTAVLVTILSPQQIVTSLSTPTPTGPIHTLILTRHGDSLWNGKAPGSRETFTGWTDVPLSSIGEAEAVNTGKLLAQYTSGINIDALFTSTLGRARMTAHHCWWAYYERLNERHYGSLQGLVKSDAEAGMHGHNPEDVVKWRRSWHAIPPLLRDDDSRRMEEVRLYRDICGGVDNVPRGESLAMVANERIRPFLHESLTPLLDAAHLQSKQTTEGGTALIVAHANSLRALIGVICNVENDPGALRKLESMKIPTASPLVLKYRKGTKSGVYFPVNCALENEIKVDLPVYPLNSVQLSKPAKTTNLQTEDNKHAEFHDKIAQR
eukprot:scaffold87397_cov70-Cyclotella_meneghiniana.AAC.19